MKVVESVGNNVKEKKIKKPKVNVQCRDFDKPNGCSWGTRCRFDHGDVQGLVKATDCAYWLEGHCRFTEEVCWNTHNPSKKGSKSKESQESGQSVFQEGQAQHGLPPGQEKAAS